MALAESRAMQNLTTLYLVGLLILLGHVLKRTSEFTTSKEFLRSTFQRPELQRVAKDL